MIILHAKSIASARTERKFHAPGAMHCMRAFQRRHMCARSSKGRVQAVAAS